MGAGEALVETYRGGVSAWECDVFGHLNIAFYGERFADAALDLLERYAPGRRWLTRSLATRYERELPAGEGIAIRSGILEVGAAGVRVGHELVISATGERATLAEHWLAPDSPREGDWADLRTALMAGCVAWDAPAWAPLGLPADEPPIPSGRDRVNPRETDAAGRLSLLGYLRRLSDACLHVLDAIGMTHAYRRESNRGFATFETRLELSGTAAEVGEGLVIASGVLDVGSSSLKMLHRMQVSLGAREVGNFYQGGVHFDLAARRSAPFPAELQQRAAALCLGAGDRSRFRSRAASIRNEA